ncbi:MAG: type II toxin-antitoxin system HipA family toxin [Burkholderiaceae bacterium]|nr:MAG: type II toxin-antitoxin system HipA family toxin [Burkholderiaceae bacterium]TBR76761.1 MAG: type II toxin-antitoxin system HipA family toxin [Burkholderiaceae bacterium]
MTETASHTLERVEAASSRLDVYVGPRKVGLLERHGVTGSIFAYLPEAGPGDFASLLMPVTRESYSDSRGLIAVFQQNLPEGFMRRKMVERFGKVLATDDFMLLALTGSDTIGRVRVVPSGFQVDWHKPLHVELKKLMDDNQAGALFQDLLSQYIGQGVSGALPKVLASPRERATIHDDQWILKYAGDDTPSLAVNEYFTMRAAGLAGMSTPLCKLSEDGRVFGIQRFDTDEKGSMVGMEDFCSLLALSPELKYRGTLERVFKAIDAFTIGPQRVRAKEEMVNSQIFAMASRNTDAHLKNFGLCYTGIQDVRLAPIYDMVTTMAYPQYRSDVQAMSIGGKKLTGIDKTFLRFAQERAGLSQRAIKEMAQRSAAALEQVCGELSDYGAEHPRHAAVCAEMAKQWEIGIRMLDSYAGRAAPKPAQDSNSKLAELEVADQDGGGHPSC